MTESILSKMIRQRRNLNDLTCNSRPVACVAFVPSLSSAISSSVASIALSVWQMEFTVEYLQARVSDSRCSSRVCLSGCSSFCFCRKIACAFIVDKKA